ncbi:MAG: protein kinase, partial [Planctomycetia bacterium]|nr:protein kinase [Planctomycetia bacterium]
MPDPNARPDGTQKSSPQLSPETRKPAGTDSGVASNLPRSASSTPGRLGRFVVHRLLGEGAFARVYLGFDPELERQVAIKVPKAEELSPEFREVFIRENRLAAIIHHPNICPVYEVGTDGGVPYIVMRMVPNTLAGLLSKLLTPMPPRNAVAIARKLALGLVAAHSQKVIHRDLKPANVLYDDVNREVLIADFGLARFVDQATAASNGVPKGTPAYMAPEQARGRTDLIGPLSDVYSLGIILYEMLTGRVPFVGESVWEVMRDHCERMPAAPSSLRPGLDPRLDTLCLKALGKHPADRYRSAKEFATALGEYLRGSENLVEPATVTHKPSPPVFESPKEDPTAWFPLPTKEVLDLPEETASPIKSVPKPAPPAPKPAPPAPKANKSTPPRPQPATNRPRPQPKPVEELDPLPESGMSIGMKVFLVVGAVLLIAGATVGLVLSQRSPAPDTTQQPPNNPDPAPPTPVVPKPPDPPPVKPVDTELPREWEDYKRLAQTNTGTLPLIKDRGPKRWQ